MFKKTGYIFMVLMFFVLLIAFVVPQAHSAAKQIDLYRYLYPQNALYGVVTYELVDVPTADPNKIVADFITFTAAQLKAATTGYTLPITAQTDYPRTFNCIVSSAASGKTFVGTLAITGTDSTGIVRTETINISTITAVSNYAFAYCTKFQVIMTTVTGTVGVADTASTHVAFDVGTSTEMGLPVNINATTDVFTVLENGAATTPVGKTDVTYNTIDFAADPDASKDYEIVIRAPIYKIDVASE